MKTLQKVGGIAALHGLLKKVRDLGLPLVSVSPLEHGQADVSNVKS
jgi:hypothetical protein